LLDKLIIDKWLTGQASILMCCFSYDKTKVNDEIVPGIVVKI